MEQYVLGVDGGGTKTHCALFDMQGNIVDLLHWGPTNHEVLSGGFSELKEELQKMLSTVLKKNNISVADIGASVWGMAGVDTKRQHSIISEMISDMGVKKFILCNDAFLGIKAGCPSGIGICVINGTGCSVAGIDSDGNMLQIGGQGWLTGDEAGGGVIGSKAIASVYEYLFRGGPYTKMSDMIFDEFKITSKYDFLEVITEKLNDDSFQPEEAYVFLYGAANIGDPVALGILSETGRHLGRSVNGIINELNYDKVESIDVTLAGSVNVKGSNPALVDAIKQEVWDKQKGKKVNFVLLEQPPVAGAAIWALESAHADMSILKQHVINQLSDL